MTVTGKDGMNAKQAREELRKRGASPAAASLIVSVAAECGRAWGHVQLPGVAVSESGDGQYLITEYQADAG